MNRRYETVLVGGSIATSSVREGHGERLHITTHVYLQPRGEIPSAMSCMCVSELH